MQSHGRRRSKLSPPLTPSRCRADHDHSVPALANAPDRVCRPPRRRSPSLPRFHSLRRSETRSELDLRTAELGRGLFRSGRQHLFDGAPRLLPSPPACVWLRRDDRPDDGSHALDRHWRRPWSGAKVSSPWAARDVPAPGCGRCSAAGRTCPISAPRRRRSRRPSRQHPTARVLTRRPLRPSYRLSRPIPRTTGPSVGACPWSVVETLTHLPGSRSQMDVVASSRLTRCASRSGSRTASTRSRRPSQNRTVPSGALGRAFVSHRHQARVGGPRQPLPSSSRGTPCLRSPRQRRCVEAGRPRPPGRAVYPRRPRLSCVP